jgi:hypothetical protein
MEGPKKTTSARASMMRQRGGLLKGRCFVFLSLCCSLLLLDNVSTRAQTYVHESQLSFTWDPASGDVDHYNVYLSVEDGPYALLSEAITNSCQFNGEDGKGYVVQVEAEDGRGSVGPISDPSEEIVVFLNGSQEDTDGDGMPDTWEGFHGLNPYNPEDGNGDLDNDGLVNADEYLAGTHPTESDTDGDGVPDGAEVMGQQDPLDPADNAPVAKAGPDQELDPTLVELDGSNSFDPNGDPLSYTWSQTEGSEAPLSDTHAVRPTFLERRWGQYGFRLVVNDGRVDSHPDAVLVTIRNVPPTADAGADQVVDAGTQVVLDGTATKDANGDPISFSWTQIEGAAVPLQGIDQEMASFLPQISGVYRFELVAFDGESYSSPDDVQVVVNDLNRVPTADAGEDQTVLLGNTVTLDGSGSTDPEDDRLDYVWSWVEGPEPVVLESASGPYPWFTPDQIGAYRFQLVVNDGTDASPPDNVTVRVVNENRAPVALTAGEGFAEIGDPVTMDGAGSYDPDGDPLTYRWTQTGGVQVALEGAGTAVASFHAFSEGVFRFQLVVNDGELASDPALFEVTVNGGNQIPIAHAGSLVKGLPGQEICLNGSASYDPDPGDTISYSWSQEKGPLVTLHNPGTATPCFTASNTGKYVFVLRVSDGQDQSVPDRVFVQVRESKKPRKDN